ncbi:MAG: hypothetical protein JSS69_06540 [Acidobacteria bacterium]|nr:hypothetical protein [Acidobacteriota bacterium]MBS1865562.1 hypothetical protein [Acidobacteriota bacterium]
MNILYVGLARTIWLFDFGLLNPKGMNLRGVLEEIGKRYQFAQTPKNELDFDEQRSLSFKSGAFTGQRKVQLLVNLSVYSDGIVADTTSDTDETTEFLNDLAKWLSDTYGLVVPKERRENYLSQIDFQIAAPLAVLNPRLGQFVKRVEGHINTKSQLDMASIQFWTEDFGKPGVPAPVKIERKIPAPFSSNHYFSQAPITTKNHIALLNEFEALLGGK